MTNENLEKVICHVLYCIERIFKFSKTGFHAHVETHSGIFQSCKFCEFATDIAYQFKKHKIATGKDIIRTETQSVGNCGFLFIFI